MRDSEIIGPESMNREGHYGLNAILSIPLVLGSSALVNEQMALLIAAIAVGTATWPDVDLKLPIVSHRGITHTVWAVGAVALLMGVATMQLGIMIGSSPVVLFSFGAAAGLVGIGGHLLGDVMTPMGLRPFHPFSSTRYSLGWFRADNDIANFGFLLTGLGALTAAILLVRGVLSIRQLSGLWT